MAILIDTWHPVNGKWVHIYQEDRGTNSTFYYTGGEFVGQESSHDMGKILKPITKPTKEYQDVDKHERV